MAHDIQMNVWLITAMRRWTLIFGVSLLGALAGLFFDMALPPRYEAKATLSVNINYGVTEPLALVVEDRVLSRVAAIIKADSALARTLDEVPASIRADRGWFKPADLQKSLRLDRRLAEWDLVAIDQDPEVTAMVAQAWVEVALSMLDEAAEHAWRAVALMGEEQFEVACVQVPALEGSLDPFTWDCAIEPVNLDPSALDGALRTEIALSHGILPNISYELLRDVDIPSKPVVWARGPLILSGGLLGIIVGLWLAVARDGKRDVDADDD